jgi:Tfp pilus assembly pilus retraction ATPase PilT
MSARNGFFLLEVLLKKARTVSRIIDMFPGDEKEQIKQQLSEGLI